MGISMHSASVPVFVRNLTNMLAWLDKAEAHAKAKSFDTANYLSMRLAPDMLPFARQIQIACDGAKGCVSRLAGIEIPKWDDTESTLDELRGRIRRTIDYVQGFGADRIDGTEGREVVITLRSGEVRFDGQRYLEHWALPNFYFHVMTTYALLRHAGIELGKSDYLQGAQI